MHINKVEPDWNWLGQKFNSTIIEQLVFLSKKQKNEPSLVFYLNLHALFLIALSPKIRSAYKQATTVYADGWFGVLFFRTLGIKVTTRSTAPDFFNTFCKTISKQNRSIYLLGSKEEVVSKLVHVLKNTHKSLQILGYSNGYFKNNTQLVKRINQLKPDLLIVGMGSDSLFKFSKQETWTVSNRKSLHVKTIWCVGALFDTLLASEERKDTWFLEWLQRIKKKPKYVFRYFLDSLVAFPILLTVLLKRSFTKV